MEQRFLGEILQRRAGIPPERLEALYAVQREKGIDLVDLLVNGNVVDEGTIAKAHKILVTAEDDFSVFCVIGDPFDTVALDELRVLFGKSVEATVAPSE